MLPCFEEKVLVVAGESWGSNVEQAVLAVQGLMKVGRGGNWSLLSFEEIAVCFEILRSSSCQDIVPLQ